MPFFAAARFVTPTNTPITSSSGWKVPSNHESDNAPGLRDEPLQSADKSPESGDVVGLMHWGDTGALYPGAGQKHGACGKGNESGAKLIEERGIDFVPTEDFLQGLKAGSTCSF